MKVRGLIYHHKDLVFHNGFTGNKYLVLLNSPEKKEPYIFVKTTSQKKDKPTIQGCLAERSLFFIPGRKTFFPRDTWVQLYELYKMEPRDVANNKNLKMRGTLNTQIIDDIVNCLFQTQKDDLSTKDKNLLRPEIEASLLKLKSKFNT